MADLVNIRSERTACNLVDALCLRVQQQPTRTALTFLTDGEDEQTSWSYSELDRQARRIAAGLSQRAASGDRVLLVFPPSLEYIAAFYGCLYAGLVAVPTYHARLNRSSSKLMSVLADCDASIVLSTERTLRDLPTTLNHESGDRPAWMALEEIQDGGGGDFEPIQLDGETIAFLQYTSGSTAAPRGVMITHANLLHNLANISRFFGGGPESMGVTWLPPYHDMGLIGGILQPIYAGFPVAILPPLSFIQRPYRWLRAITQFGATISGAPNFAYDLCVDRITQEQKQSLDLSTWNVAFNGAEPIRPQTLDRFVDAFTECGFRREAFLPCYGLAESTLLVTCARKNNGPFIQTFQTRSIEGGRPAITTEASADRLVSSGEAVDGQRIAIVDASAKVELPDGVVGEIWIGGPSVAQGYWNRPSDTEMAFRANLAGKETVYLRTGDLGFQIKGELFVTGREKDLIIIRGKNHYPQDIEHTATESHPALLGGRGAAFSVEQEGIESLVVVHEVAHRSTSTFEEICSSISRAVADEHELETSTIVLVGHHRVPKTSSGKIQRRQCRELYLSGELHGVLTHWRGEVARRSAERPAALDTDAMSTSQRRSSSAIQDWMVERLASHLRVDTSQIDVRQGFSTFGLDSVSMVGMVGDLEIWLGRGLSPTLAWDYPTIESLARHLAGESTPQRTQERPTTAEPIAIVGMGCRFPGARSTGEYWQLMMDGANAIREVPRERWDIQELFDADPDVPGKMVTRWGGFVDEIDQFDASFFGIAPREAARMDPQQRLLLEVAWEAIENAGWPAERVSGSKTGVFVGIGGTDYSQIYRRFENPREYLDPYSGTGNALSIAANRLSYILNLHGPSLALDTACSSALVAIHYACQSLAAGECDAALAGGVNAILTPEVTIAFSKARMLSPDGQCKTFDESANGYVRGEGCGIVVLKRLADALRDGDEVLAVLRGTAVNQDGKTTGITAPNGPAQQLCVRQALERAGVAPEELTYVEAHGTGTPLGDPIEVQALRAVIGDDCEGESACHLGSIKPNIGHLETASGVAGLIRVVLMMRHGWIPPQRNFQTLNPHIQLKGSRLRIATDATRWTIPPGRRRLAGVSGFGFGGTNAHLIVEDGPSRTLIPRESSTSRLKRPKHILAISAQSESALREYAMRYAAFVAAHSDVCIADVAFSAATQRAAMDFRLGVEAATREELQSRLQAFAQDGRSAGVTSGVVKLRGKPRVAMLFTGQGSQYPAMAKSLYETQPAFRRELRKCDEILSEQLERRLLEVLFSADVMGLIDETAYTQPALFAIEYALAEMWKSWGVEATYVHGHSVGEYAAACVAGVMSLEDGLALIAERARRMQALPMNGGMAVVFAPEAHVADVLDDLGAALSIAAVNGPDNTVISGHKAPLGEVLQRLQKEGVRAQPLQVSHAFHSSLLDPMLPEFERWAERIRYRAPSIPMISNRTGKFFADGDVPDARYWRDHARGAVRFAEGMETLAKSRVDVWLEVGPHPSLIAMGRRCVPAGKAIWTPSLRKGSDDWDVLGSSVANLFVQGVPLNWFGWDRDDSRKRVSLPTYPFQRKRYWLEEDPEKRSGVSFGSSATTGHPFLGNRLPLAVAQPVFATSIAVQAIPSLSDHVVQGAIVLPAAAYIESALACSHSLFGPGSHRIGDLRFQQALFLSSTKRQPVQTTVSPEVAGSATFTFLSLPDEAAAWTPHATGLLHRASGNIAPPVHSIPFEIREEADLEHDRDALYTKFLDRGMEYGPMFRPIAYVWKRGAETLAAIELQEGVLAELSKFQMHPVVLDGCLQALGAAIPEKYIAGGAGETYLPTGVREVRVLGAPEAKLWAHAALATDFEADGVQFAEGDVRLFNEDGVVLVEILGVTLTRIGARRGGQEVDGVADLLYRIAWEPLEGSSPAPRPVGETCLLFIDDPEFGARLSAELFADSLLPIVVSPGDAFQIDSSRATVRASSASDFQNLLEMTQSSRVVFAWGIGREEDAESGALRRSTALLHVVKALDTMSRGGVHLTVLTRQAQRVSESDSISSVGSELWGLGRTISNERYQWRVRLVDVANASAAAIVDELWREDRESQIALRAHQRLVPRLVRGLPDGPSPSDPERTVLPASGAYRLEVGAVPTLDRLTYRALHRRSPGPGEVEVEVAAAALNFSDVLKAMGLYPGLKPGPVPIGIECSGRVVRVGEGVEDLAVGDEVMGISPFSFATHATTSRLGLARKPTGLSFEEGATIPVAYLTAYYALRRLAHVRAGEKVLIHAAAGGVGMAAIQICQALGAEIFATAGSDEKRALLHSLGVQHVMNSRTLDFADEIREITDGKGVDVVLNSLPGEAIPKSIECLGGYGRFLEIGKTDIYQNRAIGLFPFHNNLSYFAIDLDKMFRERPEYVRQMFHEIVKELEKGTYKSLPKMVFPAEETARAFRYMANRKNTGKVIVQYGGARRSDDGTEKSEATRATWITGGLGGLGLELAQWLVRRGDHDLVLFGRNEPSETAREVIASLCSQGSRVEIACCDVADFESLRAAIARLPLSMQVPGSVYHAAGVLDDGALDQQTPERFERVLRPKVAGAWNLHELTRDRNVDRFVLFSSVAAILGSPGQSNYAAANSFLDGLAAMRRCQGLPALTIHWGPWDEVGMSARLGNEKMTTRGIRPMAPSMALEALGRLLDSGSGQAVVLDAEWKRLLAMYPVGPPALFAHLGESQAKASAADHEIRQRVLDTPVQERPAMLQDYFLQRIAHVTELDPARINPEQPMNTLGLDSLMAIELKNGIESTLGISLPMAKFLEGPSAVQLAELVLQQFDAKSQAPASVVPVEAVESSASDPGRTS